MSTSDIAKVQVRVTGRVQGVFFRHSTREQARNLGLSGWVRNEDDGSVLLRAYGLPDNLSSLITWCHNGPPSAKVSSVEVQWLDRDDSDAEPAASDFKIVR